MRFSIYELTGMFGVIIYLLPFVLEQSSRINTPQYFYSLLNLIGASCFLISLGSSVNPALFITNTIWVVLGMVVITKLLTVRQLYLGRKQITNKLTIIC